MTRFAYLRKLFVWNVLFLLANLFQELHVVVEDRLEKVTFIYFLQKEKKSRPPQIQISSDLFWWFFGIPRHNCKEFTRYVAK